MPIPTRSRSTRTSARDPRKADGQNDRIVANPRSTLGRNVQPQTAKQSGSMIDNPAPAASLPRHARTTSSATPSISRIAKIDNAPARTEIKVPATVLPNVGQGRSGSTSTVASHTSHSRLPQIRRITHTQPPTATPQPRGLPLSNEPKPFSAYQQHFGSRKPSRSQDADATQPNHKTVRKAEVDGAVSRLNDELLQLMIVHHESSKSVLEFRASAQHAIDQADAELLVEERAVNSLLRDRQRQVNADALHEWLWERSPNLNMEKVQSLNYCISDISSLAGKEGLYCEAKASFDNWLVASRTRKADLELPPVLCPLQSIDPHWYRLTTDIERRLNICQQMLDELGYGRLAPESALFCVIDQYRQLAHTMIEALNESRKIVESLLAEQQRSAAGVLSSILLEDKQDLTASNAERQGLWA